MIRSTAVLDPSARARWPRVAIAVWLLLISVIALTTSVGLARLTAQQRQREFAAALRGLDARVGALAAQMTTARTQPATASQADLSATRRALEARLTHIEQSQAHLAHAADVEALQARVAAVEVRQPRVRSDAKPRAAHRPAGPAQPATVALPFRVLGVEVRGSERFLAIAAPDTAALPQVRLLREGGVDSGWQL